MMMSYINSTVVPTENNRFDIGFQKRKNLKETFIFLSPLPPKKGNRTSTLQHSKKQNKKSHNLFSVL